MVLTMILVIKENKIVKGGNMPLYNTLKVQRAKLGINQGELGKLAGVSRQTISSIERGEYNPSITLVLKLAEIFDAKVEEIFRYEEDENE